MEKREAVTVAIDRSASSGARRYSFGTVWEMGQRVALSWAEESGRIDFIPFSASFTEYLNVDRWGVLKAIQGEHTGQSTRIAKLLRYCFDDCVRNKSERPVRIVLVCDGEPDDVDQAEIEIRRLIENHSPFPSPFVLEIITQTPWPSLENVFKASGGFRGVFNSHLFRINHDRPANY